MPVIDPVAVAERAGLEYVDPDRLPITRRPAGRAFGYFGPRGRPVPPDHRRRIETLAIPPAWKDVRIAGDDSVHILAVGVDDAGRTQYRYHPDFRAEADAIKFSRLADIGSGLTRLRSAVDDVLAGGGVDVGVAGVVRLIDRTLIRVGSERYARENGTFGASTLRADHVSLDGDRIVLRFVAKGGLDRTVVVTDARLARSIERSLCACSPDRLFCGPTGGRISGTLITDRLTTWSGTEMTAKDLRTWGASTTMIAELLEPDLARESSSSDPVLAAYDGVAARLGNTRAVTRSSYVAPAVVDAHRSGELAELWAASRTSSRFARHEQCGRKLFGR